MGNIVDKSTANTLMTKCRKALEEVLTAEGFEISKFSAKFGDSFGLSLSAIPSVKNELGLNPNSAEVVDFHRYHQLFELSPNALGVNFAVGPKQYTFEGLKMNRRKYPIFVGTPDGNKMMLTDDPRVIEAINKAAALLQTPDEPATSAPAGSKSKPKPKPKP